MRVGAAVICAVLALAALGGCSRTDMAEMKEPVKKAVKAATTNICDTGTVPSPDSNFPKGFDYPQQVQPWVKSGNGGRMRLHSWCLFAGLNQPAPSGQGFVWQSWKTSTQAFPFQGNPWNAGAPARRPGTLNARNFANATTTGNNPINNPAPVYPVNTAIAKNPAYQACLEPIPNQPGRQQLRDGIHLQSNGDVMIAGVIYNDAAINNILGTGLYDAASLTNKLPPAAGSPATSINDFPVSSIVLKPMFWPVRKGQYTLLPVWDWDQHKPGSADDGKYAGFEMQKIWTRAVAITDLPNPVTPASLQFLYGVYDSTGKVALGPNAYSGSSLQAVSVKDFYHRQYNKADLQQLSACDRALLDASAYWAYNQPFQEGDYVVLVAMHIMTKEQPEWTFQSAWWHPDAASPNCGRFCGGRPTNLTDQTFTHYYMTTTYGTEQIKGNSNYYAPPTTVGPVWPVAYNPYIELAASHPITTNCMNCHHRAAWPPLAHQIEGRQASYLQTSPNNPNALEVFASSNPIFNGLLTVDAMWAVSDRAGMPASTGEKGK